MSQTKCISANDIKNNNSTILGCGTSAVANTLRVSTNANQHGNITSVENDGVIFIGNSLSNQITSMTLAQRNSRQNNIGHWSGYDRIDVSIDLESGDVTSGSNNGITIVPSGQNGVTGFFADKAFQNHFTYALGAIPQNYMYETRERTYVEYHRILDFAGNTTMTFSGTSSISAV